MSPDRRVPLPWSRGCFVCGADNPIGLRARSHLDGDRVSLEFVPRREHAGWNGVVHGGLIATVLDEVMTWAAIVASRSPCFAAEFSVRLRRPLPPGTDCRAVGTTALRRRGILKTQAQLLGPGGEEYATAHGTYMPVPLERLADMRHDLVECDGCWPVEGIFYPSESDTP